jgi:hypothetical protein
MTAMTNKQWQEIEDMLDDLNESFEYHLANDVKGERHVKRTN